MHFFEIRELILPSKKPIFLKKTLVYISNVSAAPVKGGHAVFLEYVILAQTLPVPNPQPEVDLDSHKYLDNEVLIFTLLYNTENGSHRGLK